MSKPINYRWIARRVREAATDLQAEKILETMLKDYLPAGGDSRVLTPEGDDVSEEDAVEAAAGSGFFRTPR